MEADPQLEAIHQLLEDGKPAEALDKVRQATREGGPDPVLDFFEGFCHLELGEPYQAVEALARAVKDEPDDVDFRTHLALAQYRCCEFERARDTLSKTLELPDPIGDSFWVYGLLLEREGKYEQADSAFAEAERLDPERLPAPPRMTEEEFKQEVIEAGKELPEEFRKHLDEIPTRIQPLPTDEQLAEDDPPFEPDGLLGLFVGVPLGERLDGAVSLPPQIVLFQRNLERDCKSREQLREQIQITVWHELGHYLGLDEDELEAIDLA